MPFFDLFRKKRPDAVPKTDHAARHCFVLCKTVAPNDLSNAASIVADVFGAEYSAVYDATNIITVTRGGDETIGFLAHMPAAIPGGEAEENADGNFLWPNGREEAATHRTHVIVTNMGAGDQSPIQSAIAVSRLALVALRLFDGIGVYWGNATSVIHGLFSKISVKTCPTNTFPFPCGFDSSWFAHQMTASECIRSAWRNLA